MDRRQLFRATGLGAMAAATAPLWAEAAEMRAQRPNIIFILADDYGIGGVGCYGGRFRTPHLDALAQSRIRFEHCWSAPLCGPSRAQCLTGRYGFRTGVVDNGTGGRLRADRETTIARVLQQAGYATAVAGKWRQLAYLTNPAEARAWGFDEYIAWGVGAKTDRYWNPVLDRNGTVLTGVEAKYGPDLLHEFAVDFIGRHKDRPFFLYYPMVLIHGPILRTPDSTEGSDHYADNIAYMDKIVGRLVAELDRLNLRERTLVVFTGDNGSVGKHTLGGRLIEGAKGSMLEGGSRVPLIASWRGTTPAGQVVPDLTDFSDFFPTFAELAGAKMPEGVTIDGHSFAERLRGRPGAPREWAYVQLGAERYVREPRWKLDQSGQLFDMREAPFRQIAVAAETAGEEAQSARRRLQGVLDRLMAQDEWRGRESQKPAKAKKSGAKKKARAKG